MHDTNLVYSLVPQRQHHATIFIPSEFLSTTVNDKIPDANAAFAPACKHVGFAILARLKVSHLSLIGGIAIRSDFLIRLQYELGV